MDTYFIAFENALCSEWSGGQTRELLLLPEGSSYGRRDFSVANDFLAMHGITPVSW